MPLTRSARRRKPQEVRQQAGGSSADHPPVATPDKEPSEKARLRALTQERILRRVVSCPDCGVLCMWNDQDKWDRSRGRWDGAIYDTRPEYEDDLVMVLGLSAVLGQGLGVKPGGYHKCPPTMFEGQAVEGGVACGT